MMDERKTPPAQAAPGRQWHDNDLPYMAVSKRWLEWTGARWIRAGLSDKSAYARARETRKKEREKNAFLPTRAIRYVRKPDISDKRPTTFQALSCQNRQKRCQKRQKTGN